MRFYRALLYLYPASFRAEYGAEMCRIVADRCREASGPFGRLMVWLDVVRDTVVNALRVHWDIGRQDIRYTSRTLAGSPGFAATAILAASLGIGATTAAFSVTDHVLFRQLPFADADRLVKLWQSSQGYQRIESSPGNYREWTQWPTSFDGMAAFHAISVNLVGRGDPERLDGAAVTAGLFPLLGVSPAVGRTFSTSDDRQGAEGTVILSHSLWQAHFGGEPGVVGRKVTIDGEPRVVIGVMPAGFYFPTREVEIWTPEQFEEQDFVDRDNHYLQVVAKLKRGVSLDQARAEMTVVAARQEREFPKDNARKGINVLRLRDELSPQSKMLVMALFGAALCVLLIGCSNLANLLLARALFRRRELAVRTAIGAGRERLIRQLLTESLLLAVCGGVLGVLFAIVVTPLAVRLVPNSLPIAEAPTVDLRVLLFALVITVITGVGFGVIPAFRACGDADPRGLREGARAGIGTGRERLRSGLVLAEVTISVVLLISAGLLIRALWRLQSIDPGFRSEGVLTLRTSLPLPKYDPVVRREQFYTSVIRGVHQLPGVSSAAYISFLPMVMRGGIWSAIMPGKPEVPGEANNTSLRFVTPGFFETLGIPIQRGRDISDADTATSPFVAVVSESFVRNYLAEAGQDPLGRHFTIAFDDRTIVGVVADVRVRGLERDSEPQVYLPFQQVRDGWLSFYVPKDLAIKSSGDPRQLVPAIREIVAKADPEQPISDIRLLSDIIANETAPRSIQVRVLMAFAAVALLLAGVGIHGLLAFTVSNQTQEIGVRIALGAQSRDIFAMVARRGLWLSGIGVAIGVLVAYASGRAMQALLAGVSPADSVTIITAVVMSVTMTMIGSLVPALRAVRVDPLSAIRAE